MTRKAVVERDDEEPLPGTGRTLLVRALAASTHHEDKDVCTFGTPLRLCMFIDQVLCHSIFTRKSFDCLPEWARTAKLNFGYFRESHKSTTQHHFLLRI